MPTLPTNSLGAFRFLVFHAANAPEAGPALPKEDTELIQRPGVDGLGYIKRGKKSSPFEMVSIVDGPSVNSAIQAHNDYTTYCGTVQVLTWRGVNYFAAYGIKYLVQAVSNPVIKRLAASTPGIYSSSPKALLTVTWTLVPMEV